MYLLTSIHPVSKLESFFTCVEWNLIKAYLTPTLDLSTIVIRKIDNSDGYSHKVGLAEYFNCRDLDRNVTEFIRVLDKKLPIDFDNISTQDALINMYQDNISVNVDKGIIEASLEHIKQSDNHIGYCDMQYMVDRYGFELVIKIK